MDLNKIIEDVKSLKVLIRKLEKENKELRKRVSRLEAGADKDLRIKAKRVLGFTMSNVRGYYNGVRSVNGSQIRVYIGKDISEKVASQKIIDYLVENVRWLQKDLQSCDDLMAVKKIAKAVQKAKAKENREAKNNEVEDPVDYGNGVKLVSRINHKD